MFILLTESSDFLWSGYPLVSLNIYQVPFLQSVMIALFFIIYLFDILTLLLGPPSTISIITSIPSLHESLRGSESSNFFAP